MEISKFTIVITSVFGVIYFALSVAYQILDLLPTPAENSEMLRELAATLAVLVLQGLAYGLWFAYVSVSILKHLKFFILFI